MPRLQPAAAQHAAPLACAFAISLAPWAEASRCFQPGLTPISASNSPIATQTQIACSVGGITQANRFAVSFPGGPQSVSLVCADFGFANSGSALMATFQIYIDLDGGAPGSTPNDLMLIRSIPVLLPGVIPDPPSGSDCCYPNGSPGCDSPGCQFLICSADPFCCTTLWDALCAEAARVGCVGLCPDTPPPVYNATVPIAPPQVIPGNLTYVIVLDVPASTNGFAVAGGNPAGATAPTYLRADACNLTSFTSYADLGFPSANWTLTLFAQGVTCPGLCLGDLTGDGIVDGADLGILLGAWGTDDPCANLDGSGSVDGADLGILLGAWGPCAM
ncbi:MAG TPA: hypothetical protein PKC43_01790 [Phycisphaerales bacterium]|nr:hypothetical protein [Phycisphaerales bacterium]HMP36157.1 hypothetical protein [Phycisphaerales bacterium]